ncbi:hypothetical protein GKC30_00645 [Pseudodesulfovibrio sp. F-1]|uniref:SGNH/GDSL hydrolase family protein n=1 Tax=Pseudodesulfovibrio alkaliphilus TaxID=2661613 RepID=A0A7K1KJ75_9BACT|nr:SGNH/GDSL hydrolase family protein [Pseudodesulfovibrio alkaliphilus]MUM76138.1 hypothetical protein [Pseudodesulfovibrio alkaliphilus]
MKRFFLNTTLVLVSFLIAYGLMEFLFRLVMPHLPMTLFNNECRELRTIGQTSKRDNVPIGPYIAVIGDSYGAGQGDWFIEEGYNPNSRYQATHVLHDLTGRDVVSFSRAGAGNFDGAAIYAVNTWRYLNSAKFHFASPETVIVYFYEGNDISDNLQFLERHFKPSHDPVHLYDDDSFDLFAERMDATHCQGNLPRLQDKFLVGNLVSRFIEGMFYAATRNRQIAPRGTKYEATISDETHQLPDALESELTMFTQEQINDGCRLFDRALFRLAEVWPDARKFVVYIPSPLTTYALLDANRNARMEVSRKVEKLVKRLSSQRGYTFIDFAQTVRDAARSQFLHGPRDWNHFNRAGYELLGSTMAQALTGETANPQQQ